VLTSVIVALTVFWSTSAAEKQLLRWTSVEMPMRILCEADVERLISLQRPSPRCARPIAVMRRGHAAPGRRPQQHAQGQRAGFSPGTATASFAMKANMRLPDPDRGNGWRRA
jgi:hypothetical protein